MRGGRLWTPATSAATTGIPPQDAGLDSGLLNTARQLGGALGIAILATLTDTVTRERLPGHTFASAQLSGYRAALIAAAGFSGLAALASLTLRRAGAKPAQPGVSTRPGADNRSKVS